MIKDVYFRKKTVSRFALTFKQYEKTEYLEPTMANLFGLDMRFKEVDEKHALRNQSKHF